jgi:hypothetical protein
MGRVPSTLSRGCWRRPRSRDTGHNLARFVGGRSRGQPTVRLPSGRGGSGADKPGKASIGLAPTFRAIASPIRLEGVLNRELILNHLHPLVQAPMARMKERNLAGNSRRLKNFRTSKGSRRLPLLCSCIFLSFREPLGIRSFMERALEMITRFLQHDVHHSV